MLSTPECGFGQLSQHPLFATNGPARSGSSPARDLLQRARQVRIESVACQSWRVALGDERAVKMVLQPDLQEVVPGNMSCFGCCVTFSPFVVCSHHTLRLSSNADTSHVSYGDVR